MAKNVQLLQDPDPAGALPNYLASWVWIRNEMQDYVSES